MKTSKLFLMSVAVVLFAAACNKENEEPAEAPVIEVGSNSVEVGTIETTVNVDYSVTNAVAGVSLSAAADADWVTVTVGESAVAVAVTTNDTKDDRSATVTLSYTGAEDVSFTVTQIVPVIVPESSVSVDYDAVSATFSYSVTNPVDNDVVTVTAVDGTVVTEATVNDDSTVTVTINENTENNSRTGTVTLSSTYAKDVEVSVVQGAGPYTASYEDFIGTWTVTDYYFYEATITISAATEGSTYTVSGWHFNGAVNTFGDFGFATNTDTSFDFTAYYNSSDKTLEFYTVTIGETSFYNSYYSLTFVGDVKLLGATENSSGSTTVVDTDSSYLIASFSLSSSTSGNLTPGTVNITGSGTIELDAMEYAFIITSPAEYSNGQYFSYAAYASGNYFPSTAVKTSGTSSTSSVKSIEKPVSVKSEMKVVEAL